MSDNEIDNIYEHLQDDISRNIFNARIKCMSTGNIEYMTKLPMQYRSLNADIIQFRNDLYNGKYERNVIFGAGDNGKNIAENLCDLDFYCFIDNYNFGMTEPTTGMPIYNLEQYKQAYGLKDTKFVVSVAGVTAKDEIIRQLLENGVQREQICSVMSDWRNNESQYFDVFSPNRGESFVDCGAYDGSTSFRFAAWCGQYGYDKIWCFEPDRKSFEICRKTLSVLNKCEVFNFGASDKSGTVLFNANGRENAGIVGCAQDDKNVTEIKTIPLDEILKDEKVSFIKMDIEGSEYGALAGARKIITKYHPKLAISVYHKSDDIVTIPNLILEMCPDYKFYIRHYSLLNNETVLYAKL